MSSSGEGREEFGAEVTATDADELGTTRGAGEISPDALEEPEPNRLGRARAMTVVSPVRPWYRPAAGGRWPAGGVLWLDLLFLVARTQDLVFRVISRPGTIRELSFIHFARWIVIRRLPDHGQPRERRRQPLLMFESNYNGTFDQYIDGFSNILTDGMTKIWGTSYGFPGPRPVAPFKAYIRASEFVTDHYYSAYPTATTTMIKSALALRKPLQEFTVRAATVSPETFADEYRELLTERQDDL
jgi:hypothetical protein